MKFRIGKEYLILWSVFVPYARCRSAENPLDERDFDRYNRKAVLRKCGTV